jgi:hypothetical protein
LTIKNKINFRSTLAALALGGLVTVVPALADTVSFTTASSPIAFGAGAYDFSFNDATISGSFGQSPTVFNGTTTTTSFGGFTVTGGSGNPSSQVVDIDVKPTNINGTPVSGTALQFDGTLQDIGGTYSLVFSAASSSACAASTHALVNCGVAGTGAYAGDIVETSGNLIYAVPATTSLNLTGNKSFFVTGIVGTVAPEPATLATTGLAAAFLGLFLRRKAKQNS